MLRWDPGPAQVLGSTYVEPEDVPTMSVGQEERQMATPAERASAEDKEGNAREVYARVAVSECSVSAEDKENKEGNALVWWSIRTTKLHQGSPCAD